MITAEQAKAIVDTRINQKNNEFREELERRIMIAVSKGNYSITVDDYTFPVTIIQWLEKFGYRVKQGSQRNESYTEISWK